MSRILFVGEGPTDVSLRQWRDSEKDASVRLQWSECLRKEPQAARCGAIPIFVLRILSEECSRPQLDVFPVRPARLHKRGLARKVKAAMADAEAKCLDGVVFVIDRDGPGNKQRLDELRKGRNEGKKDGLSVPTTVGVAVEMLEAWLLADEHALAEALRKKLSGGLPDPEGMKDPKAELNRLDADDAFEGDAVQRAETIATTASLDKVSERCPRGFAEFRKDVAENLCQDV